mmetsp:Transcript_157296/g.301814  ORF Transcript_157296/g.301814 Transcript_157296/m.301814 type:complete len:214 (+) Transcript_157296:180-821(+)
MSLRTTAHFLSSYRWTISACWPVSHCGHSVATVAAVAATAVATTIVATAAAPAVAVVLFALSLALSFILDRRATTAGDCFCSHLAWLIGTLLHVEANPVSRHGAFPYDVLDVQEDILSIVIDKAPALGVIEGLDGCRVRATGSAACHITGLLLARLHRAIIQVKIQFISHLWPRYAVSYMHKDISPVVENETPTLGVTKGFACSSVAHRADIG